MTTLTFENSDTPARYTIEHRGNCVLVEGAIPAVAFSGLAAMCPKGAVLSPDTARVMGVTFAIGLPEDLMALQNSGSGNALAREQKAHPGLSADAHNWLANGRRGRSSNTIFSHLTGVDATSFGSFDTPYDPSDLIRCRLLLEQVPSLVMLFQNMATISPAWSELVRQWDAICELLDAESPNWRSPDYRGRAPKTYAMIKQAIGQ